MGLDKVKLLQCLLIACVTVLVGLSSHFLSRKALRMCTLPEATTPAARLQQECGPLRRLNSLKDPWMVTLTVAVVVFVLVAVPVIGSTVFDLVLILALQQKSADDLNLATVLMAAVLTVMCVLLLLPYISLLRLTGRMCTSTAAAPPPPLVAGAVAVVAAAAPVVAAAVPIVAAPVAAASPAAVAPGFPAGPAVAAAPAGPVRQAWVGMNGVSDFVTASAAGDLWALQTFSGGAIYHGGPNWVRMPGQLTRISSGGSGVWGVGLKNDIYMYINKAWVKTSTGAATWVSSGKTVLVVGIDKKPWQWNGTGWSPLPTNLTVPITQVSNSDAGDVWLLGGGTAYRATAAATFAAVPNPAGKVVKQVETGAAGVFMLCTDNTVYKFDGAAWTALDGILSQIAVGNVLYGTSPNNVIFHN